MTRSGMLCREPRLVWVTAGRSVAVAGPRMWASLRLVDNMRFTAADPGGGSLGSEFGKTLLRDKEFFEAILVGRGLNVVR